MKRFFYLLVILSLLHINMACSADTSSNQTMKPSEIVDLYIAKTRGWKKSDYGLIVISRKKNIIVYVVAHREDESRNHDQIDTFQSGGGKSIVIEFDLDTMTVIAEFHYQ